MTNEESKIVLINCTTFVKDCFKYMKDEHVEQFKEAYRNAIEALEKQIPKRPIFEDLGKGVRCPTCDDSFSCCFISKDEGGIIFDYCQKCGQRLDWGNGK